MSTSSESTFLISLISGGCAGIATDLAFFPIDTIKTRLQARGGFFQNGGWHGIYRGLGSCVIASAPSASLFFITYDSMKRELQPYIPTAGVRHMIAASAGEIMACIVRVPAEVIKQRTQASHMGLTSSWSNFKHIIVGGVEGVKGSAKREGIRGLYRGWNSTIMREIPFTMIQFPLYEWLKRQWGNSATDNITPKSTATTSTTSTTSTSSTSSITNNNNIITSNTITTAGTKASTQNWWDKYIPVGFKGAVCGMLAGGVAAALTTPLDVIKTRIMLSEGKTQGIVKIVKDLVKHEGWGSLWRGVVPRTCWISCGGAIFLGCYELVHNELMKLDGRM